MNWLKDKLSTRDSVSGLWLTMGSAVVTEIVGDAGFDWVLIDLEHGLGGEHDALRMLQVLSGTSVASIVRVPSFNSDLIKCVLDFGASAIMAPMVDNQREASEFIRLLRYPPEGLRGLTSASRASDYGRNFSVYFQNANEKITGIVQVETAEAVESIDEIVAVPGVDVVFVGHSDLSLSLGCFGDFDNPLMRRAENKITQACVRHGKIAGMLLKSSMSIDDYRERGFSFFGLGSDVGCLKNGIHQLLEQRQ